MHVIVLLQRLYVSITLNSDGTTYDVVAVPYVPAPVKPDPEPEPVQAIYDSLLFFVFVASWSYHTDCC